MRSGRMDRLITLREKVATTNSFGEEIITWIDLVKSADYVDGTYLVEGVLYQITATEEDHFGTGLEIYDLFVADGTETVDENNTVKTVTLPAQVWAERLELRGDERWGAAQVQANITCKYKIRYRDDVGPLDILIDADDREYNIHAVLELGRREGLELLVKARGE
jgi:SPP1 family predicted phage head-tail adaptor